MIDYFFNTVFFAGVVIVVWLLMIMALIMISIMVVQHFLDWGGND